MPRTSKDAAEEIQRYFSEGVEAPGLFTDPYTAWHCYDGVDKIARPGELRAGRPRPASDRPKNQFERVETFASDKTVTCLLTSKLNTSDGRAVTLHSCMVHFLDQDARVFRIEAYYDPHELERDSWFREHLKMYEGIAER